MSPGIAGRLRLVDITLVPGKRLIYTNTHVRPKRCNKMDGQQQQPPQYGQTYQQPPPQYAVHPAPAQPFKLNKMLGYLLIMVAVIFIPIGMLVAINADPQDYADGVKLGATISQIGVLLSAVFTMLFLGTGADLDKFEKLGLLLFLGIVVSAATGLNLLASYY
jgi:hypothetical protein